MTPRPRWPRRFRDLSGGGPLDVRLASLFGGWAEGGDPPEELVRSAAQRVLEGEPVEAGLRHRWQGFRDQCSALLHSRRVLVALGLMAVLQIGFALAVERGRHPLDDVRTWLKSRLGGQDVLGQAGRPVLSPSPGIATTPEARVTIEPLAAPAPNVAMPAERDERSHRARRALASQAPAGGPEANPGPVDPLAAEARMVSRALALLDTDPHQTLAQVGDCRRAFPAGALRGETALAELRAHQALKEPRVALAALDRLAAEGFISVGGSAGELRISRLELMVSAGRCPEALGQLDPELANTVSSRLQGRLLLVGASCRAATGDVAGSRRDLEKYLTVDPTGPRAEEIRRRMKGAD